MGPASPNPDFCESARCVEKPLHTTGARQKCRSRDKLSDGNPSGTSIFSPSFSSQESARLDDSAADDDDNQDTFATVHMRDIDTLILFYEDLLRQSVTTDAFHAISKITLDLKDLKLCSSKYPKDMQGILGDRLYLAASLNDFCIVCLSFVQHTENAFLKIRCPTCQAVEFCSGFCSLEQNTHPCKLLSKLKMMSQCKDTDLETYRVRKNMVLERATMLEANHAEALALDAQREELIKRKDIDTDVITIEDSNAKAVLTESDQYILTKLQPVCNILGLTRNLYTKKDGIFLKELAESSFSIADLRVKDPFTYAFILKIAFLFSGGMTKVQQEKDKLSAALKEIRKMSAEFDLNYSILNQTLTDLKGVMVTATTGGIDLASIQNTYQSCRNILRLADSAKLPEQCRAALNDIRKVVYFWNEIRMSNHLVDALNRYGDLIKAINIHEARKKALQQEASDLTEKIRTCQEEIVEAKQATLDLRVRLDKLKVGVFPNSGPSPAADTGEIPQTARNAGTGNIKIVPNAGGANTNTKQRPGSAASMPPGKVAGAKQEPPPNAFHLREAARKSTGAQQPLQDISTYNLGIAGNTDAEVAATSTGSVSKKGVNKGRQSTDAFPSISSLTNSVEDSRKQEASMNRGVQRVRTELDNVRSFSDVLNSTTENRFPQSPTPPPPPPVQVLASEPEPAQPPKPVPMRLQDPSVPSAATSMVTNTAIKSILEPIPLMSSSVSMSASASHGARDDALPAERPLSAKTMSTISCRYNTVPTMRTLVQSAGSLAQTDDLIASTFDHRRLVSAVRSTIFKSQADQDIRASNLSGDTLQGDPMAIELSEVPVDVKEGILYLPVQPRAESSVSDQLACMPQDQCFFTSRERPVSASVRQQRRSEQHAHLGNIPPEEHTTHCSPTFGIDSQESTSATLQTTRPATQLLNSSNIGSAQHASVTIHHLSDTDALSIERLHEPLEAHEQASAVHIVSSDPLLQTTRGGDRLSTSAATTMVPVTATATATATTTPLSISSSTSSLPLPEGPETLKLDQTAVNRNGQDPADTLNTITKEETLSISEAGQSPHKGQHRSLSSRYKELRMALVSRTSIFSDNSANIPAKTQYKSKDPLEFNITTGNSNIQVSLDQQAPNSKLNQNITLNLQKVSQYLDDLTTSMYTTEVIFLSKVWKILSRSLLLLSRINSYYTAKAAAVGEAYVDRVVRKHEERIVNRIYTLTLTKFVNTKFEYQAHLKLCYLRFNMSIGTGKNCKWKSSDEILKFVMDADQYKRLKHVNVLRIDTAKMNPAQRTALYISLKKYVIDDKSIDSDLIINAK